MSKKLAEPSSESIARANRQRLAKEEGARALADAEKGAITVRKNMVRLRALREAKEAQDIQDVSTAPAVVESSKKKRKTAAAK